LWEPTLWAIGVAHAQQTIAHRGGLPQQQKKFTAENSGAVQTPRGRINRFRL